jgi:hypothetical protein
MADMHDVLLTALYMSGEAEDNPRDVAIRLLDAALSVSGRDVGDKAAWRFILLLFSVRIIPAILDMPHSEDATARCCDSFPCRPAPQGDPDIPQEGKPL